MKKTKYFFAGIIAIAFLFSACTSKSQRDNNPSLVKENVKAKMPEYISDYKPYMGEKLPVLKIVSESGSNDFVTKPVDADVSAAKKTWGGYKGEPAPWYENCSLTLINDKDQIELNQEKAQVKVRGNWTSDYPKKGLRIKFDKGQTILGLNDGAKFKNWVLLSSYKDWSMLRDQTGLYLGNLISPDFTCDFVPVSLYINDSYWGVYILAEKIEINKNRINLTKNPKEHKDKDIGYLLELDDHSHKDEPSFQVNYGKSLRDKNNVQVKSFVKTYTIKNDINNDYQALFIEEYLNNLWTICYEAVYNKTYYEFDETYSAIQPSKVKTCYDCINKVIDLESLVNCYLLHEIICDPDWYMTSFYLDVDFGPEGSKKLKFEAPWDFDSAIGNKNFCTDSQGLYAGVNGWDVNHRKMGYGNPWFLIFINCNWFQDMCKQKWQQIHNQDVIGKLVELMEYEVVQYEQSFTQNYALWKNIGKPATVGELCSAAASCRTHKLAVEYLELWLTRRFEALDGIFLEK